MTQTILISRRRGTALLVGAAFAPLLGIRPAHALAPPTQKPILTISGAISITNEGTKAVFDRAMLEAMPVSHITTNTPWYKGPVQFEGVRLDLLMQAVGATGSSVTVVALNDFTTTIPLSDFTQHHPILAFKRDGEYMPVRDKGPLFVIYPFDSDPALRQQTYYNRSAWQVASMTVD